MICHMHCTAKAKMLVYDMLSHLKLTKHLVASWFEAHTKRSVTLSVLCNAVTVKAAYKGSVPVYDV